MTSHPVFPPSVAPAASPTRAVARALAFSLAVPVALTAQTPAPPSSSVAPRPVWAAALDSVVQRSLATSKAPGATVAIVVNGQVAYTNGYGVANVETQQPMSSGMLLRVGSVTKMFTGAMLAELSERGSLDMDAPISRYVSSLTGRKVGTVTTQQLMTHSAGWIDNAVAYGRMGEGALGEVMREVSDTMFFTDAGRTFSYSNPSISMAGYVGEVAGKQRFASLVESMVLRPTGMQRSTFRPLEALTWPTAMGHMGTGADGAMAVVRPMTENTAQWAAGFLFATAPELARFTIMLMNGGTIDGNTVLSRGAVRRITTGYVPHPGGSGLDSAMYGYGLVVGTRRIGDKSARVWTHGGAINGYNASITMLPDRKTAVVVIVNGPGSGIDAIEHAALEMAAGTKLVERAPASPRGLTSDDRARLPGRYAMGGVTVEIAEANGGLVFRQEGVTLPLQVADAGQLLLQRPGTPQRLFTRIEDGRVAYLYIGSRALARQP